MTSPTKTRTDEEIHRDVLEELRWDARVQPNEIGVSVKDGVVTLTGWTDSYIKRWSAERAAERVRGVRAVANDIEVRLPATADRTDADIAAAARRALEWGSLVPSESIRVTVSDGWVTLRGQRSGSIEKREAERVVQRLAGVRGVTNLITVRPRRARNRRSSSGRSRRPWSAARRPTPRASRSTSRTTRSSYAAPCVPGRRRKRPNGSPGRRPA